MAPTHPRLCCAIAVLLFATPQAIAQRPIIPEAANDRGWQITNGALDGTFNDLPAVEPIAWNEAATDQTKAFDNPGQVYRSNRVEWPFRWDWWNPDDRLKMIDSQPLTSSASPLRGVVAEFNWIDQKPRLEHFPEQLPSRPAFDLAATSQDEPPPWRLLDGTNDYDIEHTSLLGSLTGSSGRIRGDYLTDFDETSRIGGQILSISQLGFGIDAEANYWQRPVAGKGREAFWNGDANLIYSFPFHPRVKFRSGIGPNWLSEQGRTRVGYNIGHGLDVYLLWRLMATGEIDWGKIDHQELFRYRLALGLTWQQAEFFSGYESLRIGSERLDGLVSGVALWY